MSFAVAAERLVVFAVPGLVCLVTAVFGGRRRFSAREVLAEGDGSGD
jgi:hypothetical protein